MVITNCPFHSAFESDLAKNPEADILCADPSEEETIDLMTRGIVQIPEIINLKSSRESSIKPVSVTRLKSFASFVAYEETFSAGYKMQGGLVVEQKVLCINKREEIS